MGRYAGPAGRSAPGSGPEQRKRLDLPRDVRRQVLPRWDPEAFGRLSERFARFLGTARFLVYMTFFIVLWICWNAAAPERLRWDSYPFIFLTLILSLQASYAAPLILLAQNRQADRDRVSLDEDRAQNARAKADMEYLAREIAAIRIALGDITTRDFVRTEIAKLADQVRLAEERDVSR
ncbi:MAG TPA: DUF1003 domain-containing protein [Mycobacteriales bacterium]|nr:DUF1003 domain-containing protein [Mycobacteriales bacterium]